MVSMKSVYNEKHRQAGIARTSKEIKSSNSPPLTLTRRAKFFRTCYYIIIFIFVSTFVWTDFKKLPELWEKIQNKTFEEVVARLTTASPVELETSTGIELKTKNPTQQPTFSQLKFDGWTTDLPLNLNFQMFNNPYHLSIREVTKQMQTAKISSLKKRVKRFACWHSCFGQFKKKAIRTLYGNDTNVPAPPTPPTLKPPTNATEVAAGAGKENKERKREITVETTTVASRSKNNEMGNSDNKRSLDAVPNSDANPSKLNITNYFKLKTKFVTDTGTQDDKLAAKVKLVTSSKIPSADDELTQANESKENKSVQTESRSSKVAPSNEKSNQKPDSKKVDTEVAFESVEVEGNEAEDGEGSESPEETDDEVSLSESGEDKGDGIDRKDLEEERQG